MEFRPRFELWSDGASKRRFLFLPPGTQIDTTDPDYFRFPVGTKVWKEFSLDGTRIETRLIEKVSTRKFRMIAFLWRDDGSDADAIPAGLANAHGTTHDVPGETDCVTCHQNQPDKYAGLGAVQLDHELGGVTLTDLSKLGKLSSAVPSARVLPGDTTAQQALGILHVNCGTCHNSQSVLPYRGLDLWLRVTDLGRVEDTSFYRTALGVVSGSRPVDSIPKFLAVAGHPEQSAIVYRMGARGSNMAMPPLGTEFVDTEALETVSAFVSGLQ
jgi:hypothetical protein